MIECPEEDDDLTPQLCGTTCADVLVMGQHKHTHFDGTVTDEPPCIYFFDQCKCWPLPPGYKAHLLTSYEVNSWPK